MVVNVKLAMSISDSEGEEGCVFGCWLAPRELGLCKGCLDLELVESRKRSFGRRSLATDDISLAFIS